MGAPALVGFSDDRINFRFICFGNLGGFPQQPHASFNAEIYTRFDCPEAFPGYRNVNLGGGGLGEGAGVTIAEDAELAVDSCNMIAYEVGVRGAGSFVFDMREENTGLPGTPIPGTQRSFKKLSSEAQVARFTFDPPIRIPERVWVTLRGDTADAQWVWTQVDATIGRTRETFARLDPNSIWQELFPPFQEPAGMHLAIVCAGQPPGGACCDMFVTQCEGSADPGRVCKS
ncbi:MAG: hypothetical protein IID38_12800, partial [Planctomycetes bacterium]|nr:hypothetical protein [Planctomycetota bacterium]